MVIIIRGLPGAGKTHFARDQYPGALLLEGDQYFITPEGLYKFGEGKLSNSTEYVKIMLKAALETGIKTVVITGTSPDGTTAKEYAKIARHYGHTVKYIWIDYDNGNTNQNRHGVPSDVINKMKNAWQPIKGEMIMKRTAPLSNFTDTLIVREREFPKWFQQLQATREKKQRKTGGV